MKKVKTKVPFNGTPEQEAKLIAMIEKHGCKRTELMGILQEAQEIYGYLPIEVQKIIADKIGCSLEEVYGVVTFYGQFALNPKGQYRISVCMGTACYVKGSGDLLERLGKELNIAVDEITADGKFSLEACRCVGACGLAPVFMVNDDVYGRIGPNDVPGILKKYSA